MGRARDRTALRLLVAAFALRALFLDLALPFGDPLDEHFHFAYASFIAQEHRLPDLHEMSVATEFWRPILLLPISSPFAIRKTTWKEFAALSRGERAERRREAYEHVAGERRIYMSPNYEIQQPPLFYLVSSLPLLLLPAAPFDVRFLVGRFFASALAACAVPLAFRFFRVLFARREALLATLVLVACPGLGSFLGRFTNDALAVPIVFAILTLLMRCAQGHLTGGRAALLGLLLAAGLWTKLYVLILCPVAPLLALFAPSRTRARTLGLALAAVAASFLAFLPWMLHERASTGDWLGLAETRLAHELGLGLRDSIGALPSLLRPVLLSGFMKTFLYPGTWSEIGAASVAAGVIGLGFIVLLIAPVLGTRSSFSPRRRRLGIAMSCVVLFFLAGQVGHAATFAAAAR